MKFLQLFFKNIKNHLRQPPTIATLRKNILVNFILFGLVFFCEVFTMHFMAMKMGGTYSIDGHKSVIWSQPTAFSRFIPFIGNHQNQNQNNNLAYILFLILLIGFALMHFLFFSFMIFLKKQKKIKINCYFGFTFYTILSIVSLVFAILFSVDGTVANGIIFFTWGCFGTTFLLNLGLFLYLYYVHTFFVNLNDPQKEIIVLPFFKKGSVKDKKTHLINVQEIFKNIPHAQSSKSEINTNVFFDYSNFPKLNRFRQRFYMRSRLREHLFAHGSLFALFTLVFLPALLQILSYTTFFLVDKILLIRFAPHVYSQYTHAEATDYLNLATQFAATFNQLNNAVSSSVVAPSGILFLYAFGRRRKQEINRVIGNSITMGFLVSVVSMLILIALIPSLISAQDPSVHPGTFVFKIAYQFILIILLGLPVRTTAFTLLVLIRNEGRLLTSFWILIWSLLLNILLNWILLTQTNLGIMASALANVLVYFFVLCISIFFICYDKSSWIRFTLKDLWPDGKIFVTTFKLGIIDFIFSLTVGMIVILQTYNIGTVPISKNEIGGGVTEHTNGLMEGFSAMTPWFIFAISCMMGLARGGVMIISYCFSSNRLERVKKVTKLLFCSQTIFGVLFFTLVCIFSKDLISLFIKNHALPVARYGYYLIITMSRFLLTPIVLTSIYVYRCLMQLQRSLMITYLRTWIFYVFFVFLFWGATWINYNFTHNVNRAVMIYFMSRPAVSFTLALFIIPTWVKHNRIFHQLIVQEQQRPPTQLDQEMHRYYRYYLQSHRQTKKLQARLLQVAQEQ